ncbi:MAG: S9 family peptidase [Propionibacterium sp.]|nr:S9 family peptidase [Propionibacterium sp.]
MTDHFAGRDIVDPYRWLEDPDSEETAAFVAAQNAVSRPLLEGLPARDRFAASLDVLLSAPTRGVPFARGEHVFAWHNDGQNQPRLVRATGPELLEDGETILDVNALSDDGTRAVSAASINDDATLLAYAVADGGSDWRTIHVVDLETLEPLDVRIGWTKWNPPVWLPGGRSFTYWAYPEPDGNALTDEMPAGALYAFDVDARTSTLIWEPPTDRTMAYHGPADDDWFVLTTRVGGEKGNDLWVRHRDEDDLGRIVEGGEQDWHPIGVVGDELIAHTDDAASRYRLVAVDLLTGARRELIAEGEDVLDAARLTASGIVAVFLRDAQYRVQLFGRDGTPGDELPLGAGISISGLSGRDVSDTVYVGTTSFVERGARFVVEVKGGELVRCDELPRPEGTARVAATTGRLRVTSSDGAEVPAFVVAPDGADGPRPTLIWGYGGFNIPLTPEFRAIFAAWVQAGGTLVVPNLRGGGEFGADWHEAGTKERKQQVFDDLYAVAERLISDGVTTAQQLALHGRSNGGLLAGAALTQRPELWAAVLPGVGVLDMLRFHKFTIGWAWTRDYGNPDDDGVADYLLGYSPLHNIRPVEYPPTLITTGDHDDRVVPAHSFKFAAELQHEGLGGPFLLAVDTRAGHGAGKPRDAQVEEFADQLAFAAHHTGLSPEQG